MARTFCFEKVALLVAALVYSCAANAQSNPGFRTGQTLGAAQLNNAFIGKQDFPVPTQPVGTSNNTAASTGFVQNAVGGSPPSAAGQVLNSTGIGLSSWLATVTLGQTGGTGGSLTLNGATSGSATVTVGSTGGALTIGTTNLGVTGSISTNSTFVAGNNGGLAGQLFFNGSTSGHTAITAFPTGPIQISTGQSSSVTTLSVGETIAGGNVTQNINNGSSANNSSATLSLFTGTPNAFGNIGVTNNNANPTYDITFGSGIAGGQRIVNVSTTIATWLNGLQVGASPTGGDKGAGSINFSGTLWTNGTQGIASRTCTVNQALTLIFTNGILTGGTCVS